MVERNARFPGWKNARTHRAVCWIGCPLDRLVDSLGTDLMAEDKLHYAWGFFENDKRWLIASDGDETHKIVQLFVESDCSRTEAFFLVATEFLKHIPHDVPFFFEDDHDVGKRLKVIKALRS